LKSELLGRWLALLGFTALLMSNVASAAEVRVMISAGFFDVYSELGPAFERATGHRLVATRGPSTGDSPEAIPTRLARGESTDVVILEGGSADELGKKGFVRTDSKVVLALVQTGLVVRAGTPKPDFSSVDLFRKVLLAADCGRFFPVPLNIITYLEGIHGPSFRSSNSHFGEEHDFEGV
jgi:molybdate transport system substrate-binding protein